MLDWIFEGIVTWVSSIAADLMDAVSGIFLQALGTDMSAMEGYFPFVTKAFDVMQYMAWAVLFLITVWQLFRVFGGPITEAENPWQLLLRSALFALLVGAARPIFTIALDIARAPYTALLDVSMEAEDFTFAGVEEALKNGVTTAVSTVTIVGPILILILLIALGWNYFKLLLETVERYIVVGVLCYTSPLAYAMGGSKATNQVFKSWCRMVGSQLLLLVMNVWFLRAFDSSVGQFIGNGGALASGNGSVFLWLFCALAFLKTAQKFDSYLASLGLNVAQTGSSMAMEMVMAARVLSGLGGGSKSAGTVFRTSGSAASSAATGAGAAASTFSAGFASKFKGNSYVRDAVVEGGSRMGLGGSVGFVGRAFGGIAARNGAVLTGESIASVASRPEAVSGAIAGDIADRSLQNFMPQLSHYSLAGTQITGGHIHTTAAGVNPQEEAKETVREGQAVPAGAAPHGEGGAWYQTSQPMGSSQLDYYSADQYEAPEGPHAVVTAADGSTWYQVAAGEGAAAFYDVPEFSGSALEESQVLETFPGAEEGTTLRTVEQGVLEAAGENGSALWYNSAFYEEPDAPHSVVQAVNGVDWYQMEPPAAAPEFETGEQAQAYNRAAFQNFMPGFEQQVTTVDGSQREEGHFEVRHLDGSGTQFFDTTRYAAPRGDYKVYEDAQGKQWIAVHGAPAVERQPVYEKGKPVYDGDKLRTTNVETVRYKSTPTPYQKPQRRQGKPPKPPRKKNRR